VKDIEGELFRGLAVAGNPHAQSEHEPVRALVERVQRGLVARGDGSDQPDPVLLGGDRGPGLSGVQHITERAGRAVTLILILFEMLRRFHGRNFAVLERLL
jgi:hypothetical protein